MGAVDCKPTICKPCCSKANFSKAELLEEKKDDAPIMHASHALQEDEVPGADSAPDSNGNGWRSRQPVSLSIAMEPWKPGSRKKTFVIHLKKDGDQKFGVDVEIDDHLPKLRVRSVGPGIVEDWNMQNPSSKVLPGNYISKVNEFEGDSMKLIDIIRSRSSLTMTIESEVPESEFSANGSRKNSHGDGDEGSSLSLAAACTMIRQSTPSTDGVGSGLPSGFQSASQMEREPRQSGLSDTAQMENFRDAVKQGQPWKEIKACLETVPLGVAARSQESNTGDAALHFAAKNGHHKILKKLIAAGADLNVQNAKGETPLHLGVQQDYHLVCQLLISSGADIGIKSKSGCKAIHGADGMRPTAGGFFSQDKV